MSTLSGDAFPHLDSVVTGLTPSVRAEIPFRCQSAVGRGWRGTLEDAGRDRDCEWVVLPGGLGWDGTTYVPRFRSTVMLRLRVDVEATERDAALIAHDLMTGILTDWIAADRRGVPATTGIQSIGPDPDAEMAHDLVESEDGAPLAVILSAPFILVHGSC